MNFLFNVNELFIDEITIVDSNFECCRKGATREEFYQQQNKVNEVIDKLGEASAKAQGLHGPITTSRKLKVSDHKLYIMTDRIANSGKGCIVGMLKTGRKKLFVYDKVKVQHEVQPLCILDFYIHESRQRMGCGHKLFDFMLVREEVLVQHVAIDRPSPKLLNFLAKHYNLQALIPQVNNFVIFDGFFFNSSDFDGNKERRTDSLNEGIRCWWSPHFAGSSWRHQNPSSLVKNPPFNCPVSNTPKQVGLMGAGEMLYSRHCVTGGADRFKNIYQKKPLSASSANYNNVAGYGNMPQNMELNLQPDLAVPSYTDMFNTDKKYHGRFSVPAGPTATSAPQQAMFDDQGKVAFCSHASNNTWTVTGVLQDQQLNRLLSPRHTRNHRLW